MLKYLKAGLLGLAAVAATGSAFAADIVEGEKVFHKCAACHTIGEGAKSRVGPQLNDLFGRRAGTIGGFKYSAAMVAAGEGGVVWDEQTLTQFLVKPRDLVKGTKMAFAGLKKSADIANVIEYLKTFDPEMAATVSGGETGEEAGKEIEVAKAETPAPARPSEPDHEGGLGLGRRATADEISAWDIDVRPDGLGLPPGRGTVAEGEELFSENCAVCHGDFGEAVGRWPVLAGGQGTLADERPVKTIGSYWPYLSTVYDYIRRAMPFGNARSLSDDDVYAITAYLLYLNDVVTEEDFELSSDNFAGVRLPNESNFVEDDRASEPEYAAGKEPCMSDCKPGPVTITMRARILDVTPDANDDDEENAGGGID
ncbi:MAG: c-type cytochrome [Nitratireductor sp.]|nr:c-type cytochrome [Nitratireductor sp.]